MDSSLAQFSKDVLKKVQGDPQESGEKSENPWGELVQAAAPGADEFQLPDVDLRNPLDHYRRLRTLWALSLNGGSFEDEIKKLLRHPLGKTFQPTVALSHLLFKSDPLVPIQFESGGAFCETGLSWKEGRVPLLPELCQLSLLWALNGKTEASEKLTAWLLPLLEFKTLWASELCYDEEEFYHSAYLLLSHAGYFTEANQALISSSKPIDPFFLVLEQQLNRLPNQQVKKSDGLSQELGLWTDIEGDLKGAITLSGYNTSLGAFKKGSVEICAIGPQSYPLTESSGFGLSGDQTAQKLDKKGIRGWIRSHAQKDLWMEILAEQGALDVRFMGLTAEKKMAFVFYIKAETAEINGTLFKSKSLQRFNGVSNLARFNHLTIESSTPRKMELIPLAGEGCFWGADFLLAFEINPYEPAGSFRLI